VSEGTKPKTFESISAYYTRAVHVVFGVILGQSFFNSGTVLVPVSKFLDGTTFLKAYELILVYFIIVTSWIGYYKSTSRTDYSEGRIGIARFGTDFFILFLYYYLLILVTQGVGIHGEIFSYGLASVFGVYLLWDFLKYLEIPKEKRKEANRLTGIITTLIWFGEFFAIGLIYFALQNLYQPPITTDQQWQADVIFTTVAIGLVAWYRIVKWREPTGDLPAEAAKKE
jgi:hypothetical protein